jgi:protein-disulfide isomerase
VLRLAVALIGPLTDLVKDEIVKVTLLAIVLGTNTLVAAYLERSIRIDGPFIGDPGAKVTMVEFIDYQCPSCRSFWKETEPRLKREYIDTGKVRLVFKDFPVVQLHPDAMFAAMAVRCANDLGKYWQYRNEMFRQQQTGDEVVRFTIKDLKKWAGAIGLDAVSFNSCLDSSRHRGEVIQDQSDGAAIGVQGTPTFLINGHGILGAQSYLVFKKALDDALRE